MVKGSLKRLVRGSFRRLGLTFARADLRIEITSLRRDRDDARLQLAATRDQPGAAQQELAGLRSTAEWLAAAREENIPDPPVRRRLKDAPAVHEAVRAYLAGAGLPETVNQILLDPEFSLEDRSRYMTLFHFVYPEMYDRVVAAVAMMVNGQYIRYQPRGTDRGRAESQAETLRREGIVRLGTPFTAGQVHDIQDYFLKRPIFNGHIPMSARHRGLRRYVNYTAENYPIGCYSAQEIALAPHLLEFALSPMVLDTAAAYFGCAPRLTWLQSWWNFAGPGDYPHRQNFYHRDSNDFGMFWLYVYLTDVDGGAGPHRLVRRSGDFAVVRERFDRAKADPALSKQLDGVTLDDLNGLGHGIADDVKEAIFDGLTELMTGPAGTAFVTRGIDYHKVVTPLVKKRQIYAARFCINEFNYPGPDRDGDPIPCEVVAERVGDDEQLRYVTGLRFDWGNRAAR
jgi:hypothetical protein